MGWHEAYIHAPFNTTTKELKEEVYNETKNSDGWSGYPVDEILDGIDIQFDPELLKTRNEAEEKSEEYTDSDGNYLCCYIEGTTNKFEKLKELFEKYVKTRIEFEDFDDDNSLANINFASEFIECPCCHSKLNTKYVSNLTDTKCPMCKNSDLRPDSFSDKKKQLEKDLTVLENALLTICDIENISLNWVDQWDFHA